MISKERELILDLLYTPYDYRDTLGLDNNETFGIEIEYEYGIKKIIKYLLMKNHSGWNEVDEDKITHMNTFGGEVVSPVLMDNKNTWITIKEVLKCMRMSHARATLNTAGHIHFDKSFLNEELIDYVYMLRMWSFFEDIITKVSYGSFSCIRQISSFMASSIKERMLEQNDYINDFLIIKDTMSFSNQMDILRYIIQDKKRNSISIHNIENDLSNNNTFEIRLPNGTLSEIVWQNNINFFAKFLKYFKTDYDKELIDYYFNSLYSNKEYNEFTKTLLLGSLIFDGDSEGNFNYLRHMVRVMKN